MDYAFLNPVRIPREMLDNPYLPQTRMLERWISRITDKAKAYGAPVGTIWPHADDSNKLLVFGNEWNASVAAGLIRKVVIEIYRDDFDQFSMSRFVEQAFDEKKRETGKRATTLPSCRVDFKFSLDSMNTVQTESFEKLTELFTKVGIATSRVEHRPSVIELSSPDKEALKSAKLTAQWASKVIEKQQPIRNNNLIQNFEAQSIQALGRERGIEVAQLAMV